jgi:hypothetical protein
MMNFSVDEIDVNDYFGFTLDGNGRYLLHDYIVTHNTHCARVLAEELCGSEDNLIRIDCSEYSQPHEVSKLIGCFTPETTVTMEGGLAKPIKNIVVGDKVISKDGRVKEVKDTFKYEYDGVLYNIRVANDNRIIKCTPKHEFLVVKTKKCWYKNREYVTCKPTCGRNASEYPCSNKLYKSYLPEWVQARDIRAGDLVLQARYKDNRNYPLVLDLLDFYPDGVYNDEYIWCKKEGGSNKVKRFIQVNKDFVRMAGYYVAEGGASKKRVDISFHYDEISYQNEVVNLIRNIFGKEIHFSRCPSEEKIGHKRKRSYVGSKIVASLFSTLFGHSGAENKKLPIWWLDLPNDLLKEFLTTAILGDGCTTISRRVDYCTVSLNLATQIRNIITKLGYISYLCERPPTKKSKLISYKVYVGGKQLSRFSNDLPDLDIKFGEIRNGSKGVVENSNIQRMSYIDCDYIYKQINSISTEKYKGYVHDISVDDTLSYQVYDIIVHNSPAGYVGHDEGGYLTNAIMKKPFSVVLFDEIEKAHQKLHNILLQIFDAGRVTSGKGETVSFEDAVIILTSNVGVKEVEDVKKRIGFGDVAVLTKEKNDKAVSEGLKNAFNPEFLNRIDVIKTFNNLSKEDCLKIVVLAFDKLNKWLSKNNVVVHYSDDVLEYVYNKGFRPGFGARPLKRTMKKEVFLPISKLMLDNKARSNCSITAKVSNGVLVFKHKPLKRRVASEKKEG